MGGFCDVWPVEQVLLEIIWVGKQGEMEGAGIVHREIYKESGDGSCPQGLEDWAGKSILEFTVRVEKKKQTNFSLPRKSYVFLFYDNKKILYPSSISLIILPYTIQCLNSCD